MVSQGTVLAEDSTTHCETSGPQLQSEEVEVTTVRASDMRGIGSRRCA